MAAPTEPFVTVTLNPALDKTVLIENFTVARTNRSRLLSSEPGGKGINVAKMLHSLASSVLATGFIAGANGKRIIAALEQRGVRTDFVEVPGETRVNLKIVDPATGHETEINEPGFTVALSHMQAIEQKLRQLLPRAELLVLSGSLPPGVGPDFYANLIHLAHGFGVKTILDTEGQALRLGLAAHPLLVKPNKYEAEMLLGEPIATPEAGMGAAIKILALGAENAVVSLGSQGAVAANAKGSVYASPPQIVVHNSVGAGDAMVGILAKAIGEGKDVLEVLPQAVAAVAAFLTARRGEEREEQEPVREIHPILGV
ncbi:tagatose-6-phosphate kinase [Peptococcaceae bacterium CEB3]|nr:tagatose-6-phosphate kinase [Peptococcaceae bacterium CEB3]